jgi:hypothetical protein
MIGDYVQLVPDFDNVRFVGAQLEIGARFPELIFVDGQAASWHWLRPQQGSSLDGVKFENKSILRWTWREYERRLHNFRVILAQGFFPGAHCAEFKVSELSKCQIDKFGILIPYFGYLIISDDVCDSFSEFGCKVAAHSRQSALSAQFLDPPCPPSDILLGDSGLTGRSTSTIFGEATRSLALDKLANWAVAENVGIIGIPGTMVSLIQRRCLLSIIRKRPAIAEAFEFSPMETVFAKRLKKIGYGEQPSRSLRELS